jgi:hypothetical protein
VAKQCLTDNRLFYGTAKLWAQHYANAPGIRDSELHRKILKMKDMGVSEVRFFSTMFLPSIFKDQGIFILSCNNWNLSKATEVAFE